MTQIDIKERILEEARAQFFKLGVSRVRMEDLAYSLGMSKKTLYLHFTSKDEILQAVVNRMMAESKCSVDDIFDNQGLGFAAKFKKIISTVAAQNARLTNHLMEDMKRCTPHIWKQVEEWRKERIFSNFKSTLEAGIREGFFRNDINTDLMVTVYYNAIHYTIHPDHVQNATYTPEEAYAGIFRILMEGLFTGRGREEFIGNLFRPVPSDPIDVSGCI